MNLGDINDTPDPLAAAKDTDQGEVDSRSVIAGQSLIGDAVLVDHPGRLMYVPGIGWHHFDGTRWYTGNGLAEKRIARIIHRQAQRIIMQSSRVAIPESTRKAMQHAANRVIDRSSEVDGVMRYLAHHEDVLVPVNDLNADPLLLNCTNGTLDLRTGELRGHDPRDRITKVTGCGYDPTAEAPSWDRFLDEAFAGHPGLQEAMAQCFGGVGLTGLADEHLLPILYGVAGGGKNTFTDAVLEAMGDYAMPAAPELLIVTKGAHPTEAMDLLGARLAICSEISQGAHLNTATMKRLTGDRYIKARHLYQDFVTFVRTHLLVMVTNDLPVLPPSPDDGVFRRVKVCPFTNKPAVPDLDLPNRLRAELPGVLQWLVEGHATYAARGGIDWPEDVEIATRDYQDRSDLIGEFLSSETVEHPVQTITMRDLYARWTRWLDENAPDVRPGRIQDFVDSVGKRSELTLDTTATAKRPKIVRRRAFVHDPRMTSEEGPE